MKVSNPKKSVFLMFFVVGVMLAGTGCPPAFFSSSDAGAPLAEMFAAHGTGNQFTIPKHILPGNLNMGALNYGQTLCLYAALNNENYRLLVWDAESAYINISDSEAAAEAALTVIKEEKYLRIVPNGDLDEVGLAWKDTDTGTPALCMDLGAIMTNNALKFGTIYEVKVEHMKGGNTIFKTSSGGWYMNEPRYLYWRQGANDTASPTVLDLNFECSSEVTYENTFMPTVTFSEPMGAIYAALVKESNGKVTALINSWYEEDLSGSGEYEYQFSLGDGVTLEAGATYNFIVAHQADNVGAGMFYPPNLAFSQDFSGNAIDETTAANFFDSGGPVDLVEFIGGGTTHAEMLWQCFEVFEAE